LSGEPPCLDGYRILQLDATHNRTDFTCGAAPLDRFITQQSGQDQRKDLSRTYVATLDEDKIVAGFYTLASAQVPTHDMPEENRITRHPLIPVTLLARLAVDKRHRGKRLGEALLMNALFVALRANEYVGSYAVIVDAKDEAARRFYERYQFIPLVTNQLRLFMPMHTIRKLWS
jgi:GNAT superfamily N-acetyltransferase